MPLKKTLGKNPTSKKSNLRDKFKKRDKTVLEKMYNEREDKSKAGGGGKSCFNQEMLEQFGVKEFKPHTGDNYIEILPVSYNADIPYVFECAVHFGVGISNDVFVCLQRYNGKSCYRCEQQTKMYREHPRGTKPTDEIKALYPTDRAIWLQWDRTAEIAENKDPEYQLSIWTAPKTKVHAEIQILVRDKRKKTTLDISDVEEGGEGRTINFEVIKKNRDDFPEYKGFSLMEREEAIPTEILEQLDEIITAAEEGGFKHPLEMFLHIPTPGEVKESMMTEYDDEDDDDDDKKEKGKDKKEKGKAKAKDKNKDKIDEDELAEKLEGLKEKLTEMNNFKFKKWCKENDYEDALDIEDREEAISAIIDDLYAKRLDNIIGDDDLPY